MDSLEPQTWAVKPFSLRDAPALIERLWPTQKISAEVQKERKANAGQTLTALGSYWKGRKPLLLVRACILAALLPATEGPEKDLEIFEKLMGMDDRAFLLRLRSMKPAEAARLAMAAGKLKESCLGKYFRPRSIRAKEFEEMSAADRADALRTALLEEKLTWRSDLDPEDRETILLAALSQLDYLERVSRSIRPEELPPEAFEDIWPEVNAHLGTCARNLSELIDQLGIMRYGRRPKVGDTFAGAGSIPFEAARIGCNAYASDLNPIACMLTWGALNFVGAEPSTKARIEHELKRIAREIEDEISSLGIEHDNKGNRAKAYLYCLETTCPETGWSVPLASSWVVSRNDRVFARLVPNHASKRFDIQIVTDATDEELTTAEIGTVQKGSLVYELDGEIHRVPISTIRGDYRLSDGSSGNRLRRWEKSDFMARPDDVFRERLYCIQWMERDSLDRARPRTFFAAPKAADLARERRVEGIVAQNLAHWQKEGLVPDAEIEPGDETTRLRRERGWTHWHHLFSPRHLLIGAMIRERIERLNDPEVAMAATLAFCRVLNWMSKLTRWAVGFAGRADMAPSADTVKDVFYNQALNTFYHYGERPFSTLRERLVDIVDTHAFSGSPIVRNCPAAQIEEHCDIFVTDPPYADAVNYHEITEFFIAWSRRSHTLARTGWIWDSRRPVAIKGDGEDFRRGMVAAYKAMADHMPANGLQVVMFTHQSSAVWADMAQIFWAAGLQVMAAWYIATETTSELKKGGYVQGTVILVLRKRGEAETGYRDEIVHEVRAEVARQIDTLVGLNQNLKAHGRVENLFEDADLQMAGYAAALRILTRYTRIDGCDMTREALRPRKKGERGFVDEMIDFAVQTANGHLVPEGLDARVWGRLGASERFYLKMLDVEGAGARKLDNYQNFAKAFGVADYAEMMASMTPNAARLASSADLKKAVIAPLNTSEFARSRTRAVLFALWELRRDIDGAEVIGHLRELVGADYLQCREDLLAITSYIAAKREHTDAAEAQAARILAGLIRNERLG